MNNVTSFVTTVRALRPRDYSVPRPARVPLEEPGRKTEYHILNLGAGVQSTTLYLMSMRGEAPKFECAIFADTGEESEATYAHLSWLESLKGPPILRRSIGKLGDHLMVGQNS